MASGHGRPTLSPYSPYNPVGQEYASDDYVIHPPPPPPKSDMREKQSGPWVEEFPIMSDTSSRNVEKGSRPQDTSQSFPEDTPSYGTSMPILRKVVYVARYLFVVALVALPLLAPLFLFTTDALILLDTDDQNDINARNTHNLIFYIFAWLETTWLAAVIVNIIVLALPYVFYFVARYVNSSHRRYWRVFRALKWPVTLTGAVVAAWLAFRFWVLTNPLVVNEQNQIYWDWTDTIDNILEMCTYWVALYVLEKIMIMYICIHFHYRADFHRLQKSKQVQVALCSLYEASTQLHQPYDDKLITVDLIIHDSSLSGKGSKRKDAAKFFQKIGGGMATFVSLFGTTVGAGSKSHWFKADSSYATVEKALEHPKSAAALAKRIWMALVAEGRTTLTVDDISGAFGPYRRQEAQACFDTLDENENGDIRLNELVPTVVEAGKVRTAIYEGMHDINHAINTLDWILLIGIAVIMTFLILISYDETIKTIQQTISVTLVGLAFVIGRTIHELVLGVIFILFKHPFDVGDRVDLYNQAEVASVPVIVKRVSLLYVVFRRVDDGKDVQFPNSRLTEKRIENLSRSGLNQEQISLYIDFLTSFKDIQYLRKELENFLIQPENSRDFKPDLGLRVMSIHDMSKLELKCSVIHKSNWSNDKLRAFRSSKLLCALIAAMKKVPIYKPGTALTASGFEGNPMYSVTVTEDEAVKKRDADKVKKEKKRIDYVKLANDGNAKPTEVTVSELSLEEAVAQEEKQRKKDEEAAEKARKEEQEKLEEEAARNAFMGISMPAGGAGRERSVSTARDGGSSPFTFISMRETGLRRSSPRSERPEIRGPYFQSY